MKFITRLVAFCLLVSTFFTLISCSEKKEPKYREKVIDLVGDNKTIYPVYVLVQLRKDFVFSDFPSELEERDNDEEREQYFQYLENKSTELSKQLEQELSDTGLKLGYACKTLDGWFYSVDLYREKRAAIYQLADNDWVEYIIIRPELEYAKPDTRATGSINPPIR